MDIKYDLPRRPSRVEGHCLPGVRFVTVCPLLGNMWRRPKWKVRENAANFKAIILSEGWAVWGFNCFRADSFGSCRERSMSTPRPARSPVCSRLGVGTRKCQVSLRESREPCKGRGAQNIGCLTASSRSNEAINVVRMQSSFAVAQGTGC